MKSKLLALLLYALLFHIAVRDIFVAFANLPGYDLFASYSSTDTIWFSVLAVLIGMFLPLGYSIGSVVVWVTYFMHVFPWIVLGGFYPGFYNPLSIEKKLLVSAVLGSAYVILANGTLKRNLQVVHVGIPKPLFHATMFVIALLLAAALITTLGLSLAFPSYSEIYARRQEYKDVALAQSGALGYIVLVSAYCFCPFLLSTAVHFIIKGERYVSALVLAAMAVISALAVFNAAAFKSSLAVLLVASVLPTFLSSRFGKNLKHPTLALVWILNGFAWMLLILHWIDRTSPWLLHFFRRIFVLPGMNPWFYLDRFGLWSFQWVREAPGIISTEFFGTSGSANSGLIGSGFSLSGLAGVFINFALFGVWIVMANAVSRSAPVAVTYPVGIIFGYLFANSAVSTVYVSYGGVLILILLYLLSASVNFNKTQTGKQRQVQGGKLV